MLRRHFLIGLGGLAAAARLHAEPVKQTPFGRINFVDRGRGDPLLLLHGFPLNSYQWRGVIERLSANRRCIAPDMMAHGQTEIADGQDVGVGAQADMVADLLDRLQVKSVDIIANDSGGAVAQLFMTRHPERVKSVLLTNCDTEPDSPPAAVAPVIQLAKEGTYADKWLARWRDNKELCRSAKGLGGLTYTDPANLTDLSIETYLGPLVATERRKQQINAYAIALEPNPLAGIEAKLKQFKAPVRIVWGMADTIFASSAPDYLHQILPSSQGIRRLAEAKLFFPEEYPNLIADEARLLWRAA